MATHGIRNGHDRQWLHAGVGSASTPGSSIAATARPRRAPASAMAAAERGTDRAPHAGRVEAQLGVLGAAGGAASSLSAHAQHAVSPASSRASSSAAANASTTRCSTSQQRSSPSTATNGTRCR